jgi:2-keto-4-pentenoate hydratase/2-oxohepta-3-ene-1,7-dioic acid hydratase in catechol pathway
MKLVTFLNPENQSRSGWMIDSGIVDMQLADSRLPVDMLTFIDHHDEFFKIIESLGVVEVHYTFDQIRLQAPLPNPRSIRDYIGFEQHMLNASKAFGHQIGEAWYEVPIFYFTNHHAVYGPDGEIPKPPKETKLDLELEIAVVMGRKGSDIKAEEAEDYIFGYTIMNDWTARAIQGHEMTIPLGPHKGKDFANAFGPCIVTKDEFESKKLTISRESHPEHLQMPLTQGDRFDLAMIARINDQVICEGNYQTVYWTFPQMIERASENSVSLMPGDILGSGTVGWGCLVENKFEVHRPLQPGDIVELEIEGIGILRNKVI